MLIGDILNSCSNNRVAEAALGSIGGDFAERLRALAHRRGVPAGALVGDIVRRFAANAGERDWRRVTAAMEGDDLPLLRGLQAIVESALRSPDTTLRLARLASEADEGLPMASVSPDLHVEVLGIA